MDEKWIWAAVAVVAGLAVGGILSRLVRSLLARPRRTEALRNSAGAIASLVFSLAVIIGLVTALGIVNRESLDTLPEDLVDYIPRALSAAIVLIVANVTATFVVAAVERSLGHVSSTIRSRVPPILRTTIVFAGVLIAANQLGVDTTILTLAAAAVFFGVAAAVALIAFAGSRQVSAEVAAGRALRRLLHIGDRIETAGVTGAIVELHGVGAEVETAEGRRVIVPYSSLLEGTIGIERSES
jgi:small-conductance mechanosensitive channel